VLLVKNKSLISATRVIEKLRCSSKKEVLVAGVTVARIEKKKTITLLQPIFKDTAFKNFRIYPNPIRSNSPLTIEWKQNQFEDHLLQLFNQSGQLVFSKEISMTEGSKRFTINMPDIIAGNYFLNLATASTGRSYTEKLIVE
jgi:type IX secretion system substrate protein